MAIKNLSNFVWLYPGKSNPYSVPVTTRTAYNPLSGEKLTVRQAQTRQHGGVPFETRKKLERGEIVTKKPRVEYDAKKIEALLDKSKKERTPYQNKLVREFQKPRTAEELGKLTGMDSTTALRRIFNSSRSDIDSTTLNFYRGSKVTIKTTSGSKLFLVAISKDGGKEKYMFYTNQSFERLINGIGADSKYKGLESGTTIRIVGEDTIFHSEEGDMEEAS